MLVAPGVSWAVGGDTETGVAVRVGDFEGSLVFLGGGMYIAGLISGTGAGAITTC